MTIESRVVILPYGQVLTAPDASLANVVVLRARRAGTGFNRKYGLGGSIGDREFVYRPDDTTLEFVNEGTVAPVDALGIAGEEIWVKIMY